MARGARHRSLPALAAALLLAACAEASDVMSEADATPADTAADAPSDTMPDGWPWPALRYEIPASSSWTSTLEVPSASRFFTAADRRLGTFLGSWAKFTVLTGDPSRLYVQDIETFPLHLDFAVTHLPPFAAHDRAAFDAETLYNTDKKAILGTLYLSFDPNPREVGVTLAGRDPYPAHVVATVLDLVSDALTVTDGGAKPDLFYLPSVEQTDWVAARAEAFDAAGVAVSALTRWVDGDLCYGAPWRGGTSATGRRWAIGRLVRLGADAVDEAWESGTLTADDVLLIEGAPEGLPRVAGALLTVPINAHGRPADRAGAYDIPLAHLAAPALRDRARALAGQLVAVRLHEAPERYTVGACDVELIQLGQLPEDTLAKLRELGAPAALPEVPRAGPEALSARPEDLGDGELGAFGGVSVRFGFLRRTLPSQSPDGAIALSFATWDALLDATVSHERTLGTAIADLLADHAWPPGEQVAADLAAVRRLIRETPLPAEARGELLAALAPLESSRPLELRASLNAEALPGFTDAALYPPVTACLLDDLDVEDLGPSRCVSGGDVERGVLDALRDVFASAYTLDAYLGRLRRGFDESELGVGALVSPATLPKELGASGVVSLVRGSAPLLVSQRGAVSVEAPMVRPEIALPGWDNGPPVVAQWAEVGPLGAPVLDWTHRDYATVAVLSSALATAWTNAHAAAPGHVVVAYEQGADGEVMRLTGFRPLAPRDDRPSIPTYLLPSSEPRALCVGLTQESSVSAIHRAKGELVIDHTGAWLDEPGLSGPYLLRLAHTFMGDDGAPATVTGRPSALPGWSFAVDADAGQLAMGWTHGEADARRDFELRHGFASLAAPSGQPLVTLDDLDLVLSVHYAAPRSNLPFGDETLIDVVHLIPCAADATGEVRVPIRTTTGRVTVDTEVWLVPRVPSALTRWGTTTIRGVIDADLVISGDWARTVGVHSYDPLRLDFVFEPSRDPSVPLRDRQALEAADVRQIVIAATPLGGSVLLVGLDGAIRTP